MARVTLDGVPASTLARRWGVPHAAVFRTLTSSLDVVHDLGVRGAPHGTTVIAEEQTAGRGRDGRTWRSPEGGVWLGMLLRPGHVELGALSVRAGLVVADAVDELLGAPTARLKWPNDVLLGDRKLAGVLCETRWQGESPEWLALGVGVNVCNELPAEFVHRAVALQEFVPGLRRVDVLDRLVPALAAVATGRPTLTEAECRAFAERDWLRGRDLHAPAAGRARGLTPDGALLVEVGADTVAVREGHVELA
jgi:BirA family transcriptional regulator, biotin operon repressor / biotin---[acetyl-CoA-carboxylase] ligase